MCGLLANRVVPQHSSQQSNLARVHYFVRRTEQQGTQFVVKNSVGLRKFLQETCFIKCGHFLQCLPIDAVKNSTNYLWRRVVVGVCHRRRPFLERSKKIVRDKLRVGRFFAPCPDQREPVHRHGEMPYLPPNVRDAARGNRKPVIFIDTVNELLTVTTSELNLFDGESKVHGWPLDVLLWCGFNAQDVVQCGNQHYI